MTLRFLPRVAPVTLTLSLLAVLAPAAAHAQGALYFNPTAVRVSNSSVDNTTFSFLGPNTTSRFFYGISLGGYYDFAHKAYPGIELGLDVRDSILHGNNALLNEFLVGPRVAYAVTPRIHAYVEPVIGAGTSRAPNTAVHVTKAEYGAFAGADLNLGQHVDVRMIEIGYTGLSTVSSATVGSVGSVSTAGLLSITAGLTFRLPARR